MNSAEPNENDDNNHDAAGKAIPWRDLLRPHHAQPLAIVCLAVWLHAADSLVVATMLPSIVETIGGAGLVAWNVALYLVTSIVAGAATALLTIRHGLSLPMSVAAAVFGIGCLISTFAPSMPVMLGGRVLQGLGGGTLVSASFIAARMLFPSAAIPRVMAAISTLWSASALLGPLIGGLFVAYADWRWGFGFFAAQAFALACWIAVRRIDTQASDDETENAAFPWRRLSAVCAGLLLVASAGIDVSLERSAPMLMGALILFAVFLRMDATAYASRMLPERPFDPRHRTGAGLLMLLCFCVATVTNTVFGTLLVIKIHDVSALTAGYVLAASAPGWTLAALLLSGAQERLDGVLVAAGFGIVTASIVAFIVVFPTGPIWAIAATTFAGGAGFGMAWTFVLRRATSGLSAAEGQRVANAITTVQRLGYALGAAFMGIAANGLSFERIATPEDAGMVAQGLFIASLPVAIVGVAAMIPFIRDNQPVLAKKKS